MMWPPACRLASLTLQFKGKWYEEASSIQIPVSCEVGRGSFGLRGPTVFRGGLGIDYGCGAFTGPEPDSLSPVQIP